MPSLMREFRETRKNFQESVAPLLTPEQQEKFAVLIKEVDVALRDAICDARVTMLKSRLDLNDDQVDAVRPLILEDFERRRNIMSIHFDETTGGPVTRRPLGPEIQEIQADTVYVRVFTIDHR